MGYFQRFTFTGNIIFIILIKNGYFLKSILAKYLQEKEDAYGQCQYYK